ncbi:MAG: DUF2868 domain-containing protein [Campylobacterota bacterium]|nr:DUF2868 domain-containing protein [Campylobacterota bacterium]
MNLKTYLNLYELLKNHQNAREENRAFGLEHAKIKNEPVKQLTSWSEIQTPNLKKPLLSDTFSAYLYSMTLTLVIIAFFLGFFSGIGLLSYSGHEPVNVIYFMAMVVLLPLFTMTLTLFSMFRANASQSLLVHISPAFWMEKMLRFLPKNVQSSLQELKVNPLLSNWLIIKRSQLLALMFSLGLLVALLGMVITKDIAFAWSTTLQVSPSEFHSLLHTLAFAWRDIFPWAVPSVDLIEQSQYFRLGEKLDTQMIQNASKLGEWWKFLAFSTLFYAIFLRFGMWLLSISGFKKALKRSFLSLEGASTLIKEMNEPIITTSAVGKKKNVVSQGSHTMQEVENLDSSYDRTLGWAMSDEELIVLNDSMQVITPMAFDVGGTNSLEEDSEIISKCQGEVLFYVKSWEPPTMDFVDFLEALTEAVDKVILIPVGTVEDAYLPKNKELEMWGRKIQQISSDKVWLKISSAKALSREALNAES